MPPRRLLPIQSQLYSCRLLGGMWENIYTSFVEDYLPNQKTKILIGLILIGVCYEFEGTLSCLSKRDDWISISFFCYYWWMNFIPPWCVAELVTRKNMIRFYECISCNTTGKDGALIDLMVNKDRSLGMVRICTSLFAFGFSKSRYKGTSRMISNVSKRFPKMSRETKNRQSRSKGK